MSWTRHTFNAFKTAFSRQNRYYLGIAAAVPLISRQSHSFSLLGTTRHDPDRPPRPVYVWGCNLYGLVDPSTYGKEEAVKYPRQVECWRGISLRCIAIGDKHAAAIDADGNVYQWGEAFWQHSGIFGTFMPVCTLRGQNCQRVQVNDGGVYVVDGADNVLALGLDARKPSQKLSVAEAISDIQAGRSHLLALGRSGTVYSGSTNRYGNIFGQLGHGPTDSTRRAMEQVQSPSILPESIMSIIQGWPRSERVIEREALSVDPDANGIDSLFLDIHLDPIDSKWWNGAKVKQVACGDYHSLVLTEDGHVYGFGSNEMLQLGIGQYDPAKAINPYPVSIFQPDLNGSKNKRCTFIAAAAETSFFVLDSDRHTEVLAAGFGQYGQIGNKSWIHACGLPARVHSISLLSYYDERSRTVAPIRCRYISAGKEHAAAVMNTYVPSSLIRQHGFDVYVWGGNRQWQLGLADKRNNVNEPVSVEPPDPSAPDVDYTDLALSKGGRTADNPEGTLTFQGGQLQILPDGKNNEPVHRIYCGREVTVLY